MAEGLSARIDTASYAETEWREQGVCNQVDPELFFPERGGSTRKAKQVCLGCAVRIDCLQYALENGERFGVWGGTTERERRALNKQR